MDLVCLSNFGYIESAHSGGVEKNMWFYIKSTVVAVKSDERGAAFVRVFHRRCDMVIPWVSFPLGTAQMAEASVKVSCDFGAMGTIPDTHAAEIVPGSSREYVLS